MAPPTDLAIRPTLVDKVSLQAGERRMEPVRSAMKAVSDGESGMAKGQERESSPLQELEPAVDDMNRKAQEFQRSVRFSVERDLNMTVVKVVNPQTNEVVRQIPAEEFIEIARALKESRSLLFDAEA